MISVGMSLRPTEVWASWRRLDWMAWLSLVTATFIIPPALALLLANLLRLDPSETAGLFLVGVAPGAPLLTRNLARKGFELHLAASYQIWAALMIPVMIPVLVALAGQLYGRDIWIPPTVLARQIVLKQLLPFAAGIGITWAIPASKRLVPALSLLGNLILAVAIPLAIFKMGHELLNISPLVPVAVVLLAAGSIAAFLPFRYKEPGLRSTFAICNANRHIGLALLLSGQYTNARHALPVIACYAVVVPLILIAYAKWYSARIGQ